MHFDKLSANGEKRPSPFLCGIRGLCPRCAARTLFAGFAKFARSCRACGLDYAAFNVGDGPAAFLTLIVGTLVVALAIFVQLGLHPPFWVHILLWVPLTAVLVLASLRLAKGMLIALEFRRDARQGKVVEREPAP